MNNCDLEHPDITSAQRTGYPRDNQPRSYYCGECGTCLDGETVYENEHYEHLCERCLKMLHKKW